MPINGSTHCSKCEADIPVMEVQTDPDRMNTFRHLRVRLGKWRQRKQAEEKLEVPKVTLDEEHGHVCDALRVAVSTAERFQRYLAWATDELYAQLERPEQLKRPKVKEVADNMALALGQAPRTVGGPKAG